jgi:hypothetical protein
MRHFSPIRSALLAACMTLVAACASNTVPNDTDTGATPPANTGQAPGTATSQQADWAAIEKLEGEAKSIAKTSGCQASSECRTAGVGSRACGGPRYYIPYCAKATDSAALASKLDEVAKAEQAYNTKYQLASTCEMRLPPPVALTGGACTAQ